MKGFATMRILLAGLSLATVLIVAGPALADATLTVADVQVDVTAKTATAARDQAIAAAQRNAFARLVRRLVPNAADQSRINLAQADIERLVQDFTIQSERTSTVRYIGVYTVRFRAGAVRKYLTDLGISVAGDQQEVILLPVYRTGAGPVLWGPSNPWRTAWDRGGYGEGPVTLTLPNGDAFDSGTLTADAALAGDPAAIGALIQRYHVAGVVVAAAKPHDSTGPESGVDVSLTIYDATGTKGTRSVSVAPQAGEPPEKIMIRAVASTAAALESDWRQSGGANLVGYVPSPNDGLSPDSSQGSLTAGTLFPISVPLTGIGAWVSTRDRLAAVPGVQRLQLDALTREGAAITLDFAGDTVALQTALVSSGFGLIQTSPGDAAGPGTFQLRLDGASQGAAGQPPVPIPPAAPGMQASAPQPMGATAAQ